MWEVEQTLCCDLRDPFCPRWQCVKLTNVVQNRRGQYIGQRVAGDSGEAYVSYFARAGGEPAKCRVGGANATKGPTGIPMSMALVSTVTSAQGESTRPLRIIAAASSGQPEASGTNTVKKRRVPRLTYARQKRRVQYSCALDLPMPSQCRLRRQTGLLLHGR